MVSLPHKAVLHGRLRSSHLQAGPMKGITTEVHVTNTYTFLEQKEIYLGWIVYIVDHPSEAWT